MEGYRIVSIDPGTSTLGLSVIEIPVFSGSVVAQPSQCFWLDSMTMLCDGFPKEKPHIAQLHGDRVAKLQGIEESLFGYLEYWQPHAIVSESPYMGRFPQAYAALTECVYAIRLAVMRYNRVLPLNLIDPATVKQSIGVSGKSGDKNHMRLAVTPFSDAFQKGMKVSLDTADEHAVDALAVGIAYATAQGLLRR